MQHGGHSHTKAVQAPRRQPGVGQKHQVQAQQRQREVDEDLGRIVSTELSKLDMEISTVEELERSVVVYCNTLSNAEAFKARGVVST